MKFILQQSHIFYFLCICIIKTIAIPMKTEPIEILNQELSTAWKLSTLSTTTTTTKFSPTDYEQVGHRSFDLNLKIVGILLACIVFGFGVFRLCLIVCNPNRSSNNTPLNRRANIVRRQRPQISTIELNRFKPDLPPPYAEAVTHIDIDETKLPSYHELRREDT